MERQQLEDLFTRLANGEINPQDALEEAALAPLRAAVHEYPELVPDHGRGLRCDAPEVIYAEGKSVEQAVRAATTLAQSSARLLMTRATAEQAEAVQVELPAADYDALARTVRWHDPAQTSPAPSGKVLVVAAGTSDLPVAQEALVTARWMGSQAEIITDVGVAGLHRIVGKIERLRTADALVVVAGMEGALPSVVAGLVQAPLVAVPTSVGYGASYGGLAALLAMLNACAPGIGVVNIDNGFGGGFLAARIARAACGLQGFPS